MRLRCPLSFFLILIRHETDDHITQARIKTYQIKSNHHEFIIHLLHLTSAQCSNSKAAYLCNFDQCSLQGLAPDMRSECVLELCSRRKLIDQQRQSFILFEMKTRQRLQGCVHFWGILNNENSISDLIKQYHLKYQCCWLLITHTKNGEYDLLFYTCLCLWRLCSTFFAKKSGGPWHGYMLQFLTVLTDVIIAQAKFPPGFSSFQHSFQILVIAACSIQFGRRCIDVANMDLAFLIPFAAISNKLKMKTCA